MSTTYVPNPASLWATITIPANGDLADAASLGAFTNNFDTAYFVLNRLQHPTQPGPALQAWAHGSPDSKTISIRNLSGIVVLDTAVRFVSTNATATINESNLESGINYSTNRWYHVYVKVVAGNPAFEISTTAPDAPRLFKSGVTTHRFLFSFMTDGTGNVRKFRQERGDHIWQTDLSIILASPTTVAAMDLSSGGLNFLPPWGRIAILRSIVSNSAGSPGNARIGQVSADVSGGTGGRVVLCAGGSGALNSETYEIPTDEAQKLYHIVSAAAITHTVSIIGFKA